MAEFNYRGKKINFIYHYAEIRNLKFELERYEGYLPMMMRPLNMNIMKYEKTLEKAGIFEEVQAKMLAESDMSSDDHITAFIDFCRANPRYTYLLQEDLYAQ